MGAEEERCFNLGLTTDGLNERAAVVGHWAVILKNDRIACSVSERESLAGRRERIVEAHPDAANLIR